MAGADVGLLDVAACRPLSDRAPSECSEQSLPRAGLALRGNRDWVARCGGRMDRTGGLDRTPTAPTTPGKQQYLRSSVRSDAPSGDRTASPQLTPADGRKHLSQIQNLLEIDLACAKGGSSPNPPLPAQFPSPPEQPPSPTKRPHTRRPPAPSTPPPPAEAGDDDEKEPKRQPSGGQSSTGGSNPRVATPAKGSWKKGKLIGAGSFGRVFKGVNADGQVIMAVKEVAITGPGTIQSLQKEIDLLRKVDEHTNVVKLLGFERHKSSVYILMEYVSGGTIAQLVRLNGALKMDAAQGFTAQIVDGVMHLHFRGIVHRDLKGANILIEGNIVKLADFGSAKAVWEEGASMSVSCANGCKTVRGTCYWMAPEVITETGHDKPADVWSLGCTVIEMVAGKPPYFGISPMQAMHKIACGHLPEFSADHGDEVHGFVQACLKVAPKERKKARELRMLPWISSVPSVHVPAEKKPDAERQPEDDRKSRRRRDETQSERAARKEEERRRRGKEPSERSRDRDRSRRGRQEGLALPEADRPVSRESRQDDERRRRRGSGDFDDDDRRRAERSRREEEEERRKRRQREEERSEDERQRLRREEEEERRRRRQREEERREEEEERRRRRQREEERRSGSEEERQRLRREEEEERRKRRQREEERRSGSEKTQSRREDGDEERRSGSEELLRRSGSEERQRLRREEEEERRRRRQREEERRSGGEKAQARREDGEKDEEQRRSGSEEERRRRRQREEERRAGGEKAHGDEERRAGGSEEEERQRLRREEEEDRRRRRREQRESDRRSSEEERQRRREEADGDQRQRLAEEEERRRSRRAAWEHGEEGAKDDEASDDRRQSSAKRAPEEPLRLQVNLDIAQAPHERTPVDTPGAEIRVLRSRGARLVAVHSQAPAAGKQRVFRFAVPDGKPSAPATPAELQERKQAGGDAGTGASPTSDCEDSEEDVPDGQQRTATDPKKRRFRIRKKRTQTDAGARDVKAES